MVSKKIVIISFVSCILISTFIGITLVNNFGNLISYYPRTINDSLDRNVGIPEANNIDKIIGINPGGLRLLVYMEAQDLVCGVEDFEREPLVSQSPRPYTLAYPGLSALPSIGPQFGGDPELIIAQKPDVIFSSTNFFTAENADELQILTGIPVVAVDDGLNSNINNLMNSFDIIAEILNKTKRAELLKNYIEDFLFDLDNRTKNIAEQTKEWIYVGGIGYRGSHGILSTDSKYSPLEYINGKNTAKNISTQYATIDLEQLFYWENNSRLDYIVVDEGGYEMCMEDFRNTEAGNLLALKTDPPRVVMTLPYNLYSHNYATIFADAYYLGKRFFPSKFSDLNYTEGEIYDKIYDKFLGARIYQEIETHHHGGFHNFSFEEIFLN